MSERKLQRSILSWLENTGFYAVKTIISNKSGTPDILACSPKGRFIAIEVKYGKNKPTKLQEYNLNKVSALGGIAFTAWDLNTVKHNLQGELTND